MYGYYPGQPANMGATMAPQMEQGCSNGYFQDQGPTLQYPPQMGYYPQQMPPQMPLSTPQPELGGMPNMSHGGYMPQMSMQQMAYQCQPNYFPVQPQMDFQYPMGSMGNMGNLGMNMMGYMSPYTDISNPFSMPYGTIRPRQMDKGADGISGRWRDEEHDIFLKGLNKYGRKWKKISLIVKTRTAVQIRTHAQKYFQSLLRSKDARNGRGPITQNAVVMAHAMAEVHGEREPLSEDEEEEDKISQITDNDDSSSECHMDKKRRIEAMTQEVVPIASSEAVVSVPVPVPVMAESSTSVLPDATTTSAITAVSSESNVTEVCTGAKQSLESEIPVSELPALAVL
jgi:SHAQKYF class myb-like DNA-binding protein